jgi:arylsulfatase A-like enzyme
MSQRINILLAVVSGARADHSTAYGYERDTTPFLAQLAREGVRAQQMISTSTWTLPSHASLFTGLFPSLHGATEENHVLSSRPRLLAEILHEAGYRTAAFCPNPWVSPETGFGRGFDRFHTQRVGGRFTGSATDYARRASDRVLGRIDAGARRTNVALLAWLETVREPFFAFVHYREPHLPLRPPAPYDRMFLPATADPARLRSLNQDSAAFLSGAITMDAADLAVLTAAYDGALRYVDMRLQEVAAVLAHDGRWDRTLVIVLGDHGEHLGEHGMIGHQFGLYDSVLRAPLILRCPDKIPRGFVVDEIVQPIDVLPTVLELAAVTPPDLPLGRAILRHGQATPGPSFAIAEGFRCSWGPYRRRYPAFEWDRLRVRTKAVRTRREKFIWRSDEANELYDLARDPHETHNLIANDTARGDASRRMLFDWLAATEATRAALGIEEEIAGTRGQLQRLGEME